MHRVILKADPLAVLSSGNPRVEHGNPISGCTLLLHKVTPDPVSNNALTLTSPKEISALGLEYSVLEGLKQFKAARHVINDWGMNRLIAIPHGRFPRPMDSLDRPPDPARDNIGLVRRDLARTRHRYLSHGPGRGKLD